MARGLGPCQKASCIQAISARERALCQLTVCFEL